VNEAEFPQRYPWLPLAARANFRRAKMLNRLFAATILLPLVVLGACNATEGEGKDMQSAGKEISKTADENK
jgi:predicted small secreted protein